MRMTSFIIGGIVGASLAMYANRNNETLMQTLSNVGQFVNKIIDPQVKHQMSNLFEEEDTASTYQMQ